MIKIEQGNSERSEKMACEAAQPFRRKLHSSPFILYPLSFLRRAGNILAAIWIFGGMVFFLIRFSSVFYFANRGAILRFLDHVSR